VRQFCRGSGLCAFDGKGCRHVLSDSREGLSLSSGAGIR
jgi:hypothetical protein